MHLVNNRYTTQFMIEAHDVKESTRHGVVEVRLGYTWRWYQPFVYVRIGRYTFYFGWFLSQKTTEDSSLGEQDYG